MLHKCKSIYKKSLKENGIYVCCQTIVMWILNIKRLQSCNDSGPSLHQYADAMSALLEINNRMKRWKQALRCHHTVFEKSVSIRFSCQAMVWLWVWNHNPPKKHLCSANKYKTMFRYFMLWSFIKKIITWQSTTVFVHAMIVSR